jgi:hypothetical protein
VLPVWRVSQELSVGRDAHRSSGQGGVSWDETGEVGSLDAGDGLEFLLAKLPWTADLLGPPRNVGSGSGCFLAKPMW